MLPRSEEALGDCHASGIFSISPYIPSLFLMPSFVAADAFYDYFNELVVGGSKGP